MSMAMDGRVELMRRKWASPLANFECCFLSYRWAYFSDLKGTIMQWTKPAFTDMRFGFEITMYIANR